MKLLLSLCALLSGCATLAPQKEWRHGDTVLEVGFQVLNAIDARTTSRIIEREEIEEVQPITRALLGAEPKPRETAVYFATLALTHYLISRALPQKWRGHWQAGTLTYSAIMVKRNCGLGLCLPPEPLLNPNAPTICVGRGC